MYHHESRNFIEASAISAKFGIITININININMWSIAINIKIVINIEIGTRNGNNIKKTMIKMIYIGNDHIMVYRNEKKRTNTKVYE